VPANAEAAQRMQQIFSNTATPARPQPLVPARRKPRLEVLGSSQPRSSGWRGVAYVLCVLPPMVKMSRAEIVDWVGPTIQRYLGLPEKLVAPGPDVRWGSSAASGAATFGPGRVFPRSACQLGGEFAADRPRAELDGFHRRRPGCAGNDGVDDCRTANTIDPTGCPCAADKLGGHAGGVAEDDRAGAPSGGKRRPASSDSAARDHRSAGHPSPGPAPPLALTEQQPTTRRGIQP